MLSRVPHVADVEPSLCDDHYTMEFKSKKRIVQKNICVVHAGDRAGEMYSVNLQQGIDKALANPDVTAEMLSVWLAMLAHSVQSTINKMAKSGAVRGMEKAEGQFTNNCSSCVEEPLKNSLMHSQTALETWLRAVLHTVVAEMNVS